MSALKEKILRHIAADGPLTVAQYMTLALADPEHGYYMKRDPLGARGDFITAPEVSQIFGELIGLWFVQAWEDRGKPKRFYFAELGPGRATLMADMLRAARIRSDFIQAAQVILVEISPVLREAQRQTLHSLSTVPKWASDISDIPYDAPLFVVANEFLDALPIRQFVKSECDWRERMIAARDGKLIFALKPENASPELVPEPLRGAPQGSIFECTAAAEGLIAEIAKRVTKSRGVALFIDYGPAHSGLGETFQAVKAHKFTDLLDEPGEVDLTAHVDFEALTKVAKEQKAQVFGPVTQQAFLEALGIRLRAETLKHKADATTRAAIDAGVDRLIGAGQMGTLFKVMAIAAPGARPLPGFPC